MEDLKIAPKHGFASTAATVLGGTDQGFQHRKSHNLSQAHLNRDISYGKHRSSVIEKGFFSKDKLKFDPTYPGYNSLSFGKAKINDIYDLKAHTSGKFTQPRRKDVLDHYR